MLVDLALAVVVIVCGVLFIRQLAMSVGMMLAVLVWSVGPVVTAYTWNDFYSDGGVGLAIVVLFIAALSLSGLVVLADMMN